MSQSQPSIYRRRAWPSSPSFRLAPLLLALWGAASSATEPPAARPSVTLFVVGAPEARASVQSWARERPPGLPVTLRLAELPASTTRPGGDVQLLEVERHLQEARRHYIHAEFADCLQQVGDEGVLSRTLSQGHRALAARLLLWQVACQVGLRREEAALQVAAELGVLGLELPADIGVLPPEVGRVLVAGAEQGAARGRATLRITADSSPARISLDGRPGVCMAPCSLEVLEGRHVVRVDAEGRQFAVQVISARGPELAVAFTTLPASPELAAGQWSANYGESLANLDSAGSLSLLSTALRAPRLVLLTAEAEREGYRLRGALALQGRAAARTERQGEAKQLHGTAEGVLRDLLIQGQVVEPAPALYQRRDFWIAVGVAAVIAGAATTALLWQRPVRTEVGF
ncbi:PEGA domain-containing protein [Corallococcus macrosporus]|uniref:PEGA domain-containing protein n=1 Tax=Corallococcus macrosporus DSM 14697 TaxID=1189310 RepID=A0A250JLZ4_9BACT|nr:PEGA domain-containing protein [Corallococcus macrosporus]ATB44885.1 hypothetical protein MYMAC_000468 [Corallococcus macrosporus DSM 14697]